MLLSYSIIMFVIFLSPVDCFCRASMRLRLVQLDACAMLEKMWPTRNFVSRA